jgi:hypothetical protein
LRLVNFRELVQGDVATQDNPFYHRRISGNSDRHSWEKPNGTSSNSTLQLDNRIGKGDGQIELAIKAGYWAEFQIRTNNWSHYSRLSWDVGVNEVNVFDKNTDSFIDFKAFGGSAVAVSPDKVVLSQTMADLVGLSKGTSDYGTILELAPPPTGDDDDTWNLRKILYKPAHRRTWVTLTGWGRDAEHGRAVQEETFSVDSDEYQAFLAQFPDATVTDTAVFSEWTYDRYIEGSVDGDGWLYDISIGWTNPAGPFYVMVNGYDAGYAATVGEAQTEADRLNAEWKAGSLPPIYRREKGEKEEPPEQWKPFENWDLNWWKVGGAGALILGVVAVGVVLFFMARGVGQNVANKATGSE